MLTPAHSELASSLTRYYFGDNVAAVVQILFGYDQASFRLLKYNLPKITPNDIKKSLLILVKYQLVDYIKSVKNHSQQYEYSVSPNRIFSFFRISRFIETVKDDCEQKIFQTVVSRGLLGMDKLVDLTCSHLQPKVDEDLKVKVMSKLSELTEQRYIARTGGNLCVNIERLARRERDCLIVETVDSYYNRDPRIRALCESILRLTLDNTADDAQITAPCSALNLSEVLKTAFESSTQMERYLIKLTSESNNRFFMKCGQHNEKGSMYAINIGLVLGHLVKEHLSAMIATRFGPNCCRVFKLLLLRGPMLPKQIEEVVMLPGRDVREYCYMLVKAGFVRNRQVPKTPDNAPGKSVFIMSVELDQVVFTTADLCCRSMINLLARHSYELQHNKLLLDKSKAVEDLVLASGQPADANEWMQYFSSHELTQIEIIKKNLDKLLRAKAQVDETLFLLHSYMQLGPL